MVQATGNSTSYDPRILNTYEECSVDFWQGNIAPYFLFNKYLCTAGPPVLLALTLRNNKNGFTALQTLQTWGSIAPRDQIHERIGITEGCTVPQALTYSDIICPFSSLPFPFSMLELHEIPCPFCVEGAIVMNVSKVGGILLFLSSHYLEIKAGFTLHTISIPSWKVSQGWQDKIQESTQSKSKPARPM